MAGVNSLREVGRKYGGPALPVGVPQDLPGFVEFLRGSRDTDWDAGMAVGAKHFGEGNPAIKELLDTRKQRALGLNAAEVGALRARGTSGINQTMATGMRQLRGMQAASGLRGGAALGQVLPVLAKANMARGALESDIAIADMDRRSEALKDYESTLTGERAGHLGMGLGFAGLGAADRSSALQHILGSEFAEAARLALGGAPKKEPTPMPAKWQAGRDAAEQTTGQSAMPNAGMQKWMEDVMRWSGKGNIKTPRWSAY